MPYYKFGKNDLFYNRLKTYPSLNFYMYDEVVIYNNETQYTGDLSSANIKHVPPGNISLYELNIDRPANQLIFPFVTKDGSLTSFKTISTTAFNNDFAYGDIIAGTYPLSASISSDRFATGQTGSACRYFRGALKNTFNRYSVYSPHYAFSSSLGDKGNQEIRIISIPSIFFGSSIKRGSCSLKFFVSGTLVSELKDDNRRGVLRQTNNVSGAITGITPTGSVAGVVLYDEGFIVLTGSWDLSNHIEDYGGVLGRPRWLDFAYTGSTPNPLSSFQMAFNGTTYTPTLTMFTHMPKAELNHSNNPTFLTFGQTDEINTVNSGSSAYVQNSKIKLKNIVKTNFEDPPGEFQKITYINQVGLYDKYMNLIAIAKLATPLRKRETDELTIKLKLDF